MKELKDKIITDIKKTGFVSELNIGSELIKLGWVDHHICWQLHGGKAAVMIGNWMEGDMRFFAMDKVFDLALIPSHSFQNLNTPDDQAVCLENIWRYLKPGGLLVVHLDHMNGENMKWLGEISGGKGGIFEEGKSFKHPETGLLIKPSAAWSYEPPTQAAVL